MYIAEVYLLHCSSNLVAPSSPLCQYHVPSVHLSLSLSSSLSAFHVHAHGFIFLFLSLSLSSSFSTLYLRLPPIPLHPATAIPPSPFSLRTNVRKWIPYLDLEWFSKSFAHMRPPTQTHTTHVTAQCTRIHTDPRARRTQPHTATHLTGITMIDTRVPLFSFLPSPPLSLFSRSTPDLFRSFCNWLAASQNSLVLPRTRTPEFDV